MQKAEFQAQSEYQHDHGLISDTQAEAEEMTRL
jgi:hypothetical protein